EGVLLPYWTAPELARSLGLRDWLLTLAGTKDLPELPLDARIDACLRGDPVCGLLHALVLEPPAVQKSTLWGRQQVVVPVERPIAQGVLDLWRLAWVERLAAQHGQQAVFGPGAPLAGPPDAHLAALRTALAGCPAALRRFLALAEFLCRVLDGTFA